MKMKSARLLLAIILLSPFITFSQRGKDLNYTVTSSNTVVNSYTYLLSNAVSGTSTLNVNSNALTGGAFSGNLAAGDLLMIIQMQGATMDIDVTPTVDWGGNYTKPVAYLWDFNWAQSNVKVAEWGKVTSYNNSGKFEQVEVLSVSGTNTITLSCPLQNSYTSAGHVQVVRVPRFNDLTVNTGTTIVPTAWNGSIGGVVAVEVNGNLILNNNSKITASAKGFRGGAADHSGFTGSCTLHPNGDGNGGSQIGSSAPGEGGRKGEGIGGYTTEYLAVYSSYGSGSPANGGGGGGYQNAGGGGGSNIGTGTYTGKGVPSTTYANGYWNIELAGFAGSSSPGGGRGGYALSGSNQDALTLGPNESAWCGTATTTDARKENGGLGGHPLAYDATRLFMGGGGGAGDQDSGQGGSGGIGGGIVFVTCYGSISGSGSIESDGGVGSNSNPNNQSPSFGQKKGNDGAGGGGAGGAVFIKNSSAIPAGISILARGGNGGNHNLSLGTGASSEGSGPGGGGAGGSIAITSGTPTLSVAGGLNGTSNSSQLTEFIANGATNGSVGMSGLAAPTYNITTNNPTICSGLTATLTATITGTSPGTLSWYSQQFGGSPIASGNSYTTPTLSTTTTYYVGFCPGTFRVPVVVTVNPSPIISGTAVLTNPTCSSAGSITGLTVSNGTPNYTYNWSGTVTAGPDYTNIPAGTYTLTVTDLNGCTDTDGPYTLTGTSGPIINASGVTVTDQNCSGSLGSITGITATGTGLIYSWSNGGGSNLNATNLTAGSYTLTVTDGNGCTATSGPYTVNNIVGPSIDASGIVLTPATCGNANGSITGITATGTGLSYLWSNSGGTNLNATNLAAGSYSLTVTDVNGCTASSGPHTISAIAGPTISSASVIITPETCNQSNGSVTGLSINGGTPIYTIAWTGTSQTTLDITNLTSGNYSITVTDQNGCIANAGPFNVTGSSGPVINATGVLITDQNCNGTMGSITGITVTGTGLLYSWSNGGGSSLNANNLVAGSYTLTVTDGNGCIATSGPYTINNIVGPTIDATGIVITPETCGNVNGAISGITASGTGLSYEWNSISSATLNISNQSGGNYTLEVTDGNGCTATSGPYTIPAFAGPTISLASIIITPENCNQGNGSITGLTINGGTPIYSISWTGTIQTTLDISNLTAGDYSLTVTDQNGCIANAGPFTILNSGGPTVNISGVSIQDQSCNGTMGSITGITATGTGLSYLWTNGGGSNLDATNLTAGSYSLTVTDGNGCTVSAGPYTINYIAGPSIDATGVLITTAYCGNANGGISGITASGTGLTYTWNGTVSPTIDISGQNGGNFTIVVTDINGCTATAGPYTIPSVAGPTISASTLIISPENCNQGDGSITGLVINGGTPIFTISWTGTTQTTLDINNLTAGSYTLTVTDQNGCTVSSGPHVVANAGGPILNETNAISTNILCDGTLGTITGITASGTGLTYSWTNGGGNAINASGLVAGSYVLTVTDVNGCMATSANYTISAPVPFSIDLSNLVVGQTACTSNTGTITGIVLSGGINPTFSWSNSASTLDQANLSAGTYTITATDDQGCSDSETVTITMVNAPVIDTNSMVLTAEHCDLVDASISGITVSGGTTPYSYEWNSNAAMNTIDLSNISSGIYSLVVTDDNGCTASVDITTTEISASTINDATLIITQPTCLTPGAISGLAISGSSPYSYAWTNTSQTTLDLNNLSAGNYTLTLTDGNGCSSTYGPVTLNAPSGPIADFNWTPANPNVDETIYFTDNSSGSNIISYSWTIDGQVMTSDNFDYAFSAEGQYDVTLSVIDANGCVSDTLKVVTVYGELIIPNVITVNNDDVNETFEIKGLKPNTELIILNRWGNVVLEIANYQNDWKGKDTAGNDLDDGVYTYLIKTPDGKLEHGFVHLYR